MENIIGRSLREDEAISIHVYKPTPTGEARETDYIRLIASTNKTAAQQFIIEVLSKAGQKKMLAAGFLPITKTKSGY
jgi:hypothetical protein